MPAINFTDDELAAVTAALRRLIEDDRFPHAPRLDPLRAALGKLEAASSSRLPSRAVTDAFDPPPLGQSRLRAGGREARRGAIGGRSRR